MAPPQPRPSRPRVTNEALAIKLEAVHDGINEMKDQMEVAMPAIAAHEMTLYGKDNEGGVVRELSKLGTDLTNTKWGVAVGLITLLVGILAAKAERWI